jgi:hypothetical protein
MDYFDRDDVKVIHSTYKDNEFVSKKVIKELKYKASKDKNFKRVYLDGKIGVAEGLIFNEDINFEIVNKKPSKKIKQMVYGCDFGFNDPTTLIELSLFEDNTVYVKELLYKTKLTPNKLLKEFNSFKEIGKIKIIADSARPELVEHLFNNKYNIHSVKKTTILDGINKMMDFYMYIDINSNNIINELYNYVWEKNKNDEEIEKPIDDFNHCFIGSTQIKTIENNKNISDIKPGELVLTSDGYKPVLKKFNNGFKTIFDFEITTIKNKYILSSTENHKIKTDCGWIEIDNLLINNKIYNSSIKLETITNIKKHNKRIVEVYDLMIDETHEYIANDILVHNCIDAIRY